MGFKKIVLDPKGTPTGFHLTQIQDNVDQALREISNFPLLKGVFVDVSLLTGQDNFVNTGLGRDYLGFFVCYLNANAVVWNSSTPNPFPNKQIFLKASADVTVKLYIF